MLNPVVVEQICNFTVCCLGGLFIFPLATIHYCLLLCIGVDEADAGALFQGALPFKDLLQDKQLSYFFAVLSVLVSFVLAFFCKLFCVKGKVVLFSQLISFQIQI